MLELLNIFINNIVPIMLIAAAGVWLGKRFEVPPKPLSTMLFYVFSPALTFQALYVNDIDGGEFVVLFVGTALFQFILAGLTYLILRLRNTDPLPRTNVILATTALNAGNYGLPLVDFAFGAEVFSRAVVVFIANTVLNYSFGVFIASNGRGDAKQAVRAVLGTPAIYAAVLALGLRGLGIEMPLTLARAAETASEAAIPLMLVLLGVQVSYFVELKQIDLVAIGAAFKLLLSPVVGFGLALLLGMNDASTAGFIMQVSMPTAVLTIVLATEFDLDIDLTLNLLLVSTALSPVTLSVLIALLT